MFNPQEVTGAQLSANAGEQGTGPAEIASNHLLREELPSIVPTGYRQDEAFVVSRLTTPFHIQTLSGSTSKKESSSRLREIQPRTLLQAVSHNPVMDEQGEERERRLICRTLVSAGALFRRRRFRVMNYRTCECRNSCPTRKEKGWEAPEQCALSCSIDKRCTATLRV
jgi:hypothetical protein